MTLWTIVVSGLGGPGIPRGRIAWWADPAAATLVVMCESALPPRGRVCLHTHNLSVPLTEGMGLGGQAETKGEDPEILFVRDVAAPRTPGLLKALQEGFSSGPSLLSLDSPPRAPGHIHLGAGPPFLPLCTCTPPPVGAGGGAPDPPSQAVRLAVLRGLLGRPEALLGALLSTLRSPSRGPSGGPSGLYSPFSGVGGLRFCSLMPLGENGRYLPRELAASACLHPNGLFASLWKDLEERRDFSFQSPKLERAPQWRGCQGPAPLA